MNKEEKNLRKIRFKNMTLKEKASYLFMYYKFHALALLFLSVFIISLIASMISGSREISFYASFTNADISFDFDGYAGGIYYKI